MGVRAYGREGVTEKNVSPLERLELFEPLEQMFFTTEDTEITEVHGEKRLAA